MKRHQPALLVLGATHLVVSACTSRTERLIRAGEDRWASQDITAYEIIVMEASFWHAQDHHLVVQDGVIVAATATCNPTPIELGTCEVEAFDAEVFTVEGLFRIALICYSG